jgi:hypothetical protein
MTNPKDVQAGVHAPTPDTLAIIRELLAGNAVVHPEAERVLAEYLNRPILAPDDLLRVPDLELPHDLLDGRVEL